MSFILLSCADDGIYSEKLGSEIAFNAEEINGDNWTGTNSPSSRGIPLSNLSDGSQISVFAYHNTNGSWTPTNDTPNFMNGDVITKSLGQWGSAPTRYWPDRGSISFFGFYPAPTNSNGLKIEAFDGGPVVSYTVPTDVKDQPDFMVGNPQYDKDQSMGSVAFKMSHALTAIGFRISGNNQRITKISIKGVNTRGKLSLDTGSSNTPKWNWTDLTVSSTEIMAGIVSGLVADSVPQNAINSDGYLMMIPQQLPAGATLVIRYDGKNKEIPISGTWEAGQKIIYNVLPEGVITVTPPNLTMLAEASTAVVNVTCNNQNLNWNMSLPTAATWLTIGTRQDGSDRGRTIQGTGSMPVYVFAEKNYSTTSDRGSYISLNSSVAVLVTQLKRDNGIGNILTDTYVGAFWRNSEIEERIIQIPKKMGTTNVKDWTVKVAWVDSKWKPGDIIITDTEPTGGWSPCNRFPEVISPSLNMDSITGSSDIKFRIGLRSTNVGAPRYAVILITFRSGAIVPTHYKQYFYIRQGEESDYVMRPGDLDDKDNAVVDNRAYARKISPYNLTAQEFKDGSCLGGALAADHIQLSVRGGVFVDYPTQGGATFQWASIKFPRYAYHPTNAAQISDWGRGSAANYSKSWDELKDEHEVCPPGYKRITDGPTDVISTTSVIAGSELRQSLSWNLPNTTTFLSNKIAGKYADGLFDRYDGGGGYEDSFDGVIYFNVETKASCFFPKMMSRLSDGTARQDGRYWTSSFSSTTYAKQFTTSSSISGIIRFWGLGIRCVKE